MIAEEDDDPARDRVILEGLRKLKLSSFAASFHDLARQAEKDGLSYERYLQLLVDLETQERQNRRIARLTKSAKLPADKTLERFDLKRVPNLPRALVKTLSEGHFLDRAENILVFGNPGTGKTHLLCGIARELLQRGRSVLFTPAFALVQSLARAKRDLRLEAALKRLDRFEAVLLDDIGYVRQEREEMEVLFAFLSHRYERRSVLITSNLVFSRWEEIFKDSMMTAAAIDRLVHHARIIELNVESYRAEEANRRQAKRRNRTKKEKPAQNEDQTQEDQAKGDQAKGDQAKGDQAKGDQAA